MDAVLILILVIGSLFSLGHGIGKANGRSSEQKKITTQCERIGQVIINDKVYECKLKENKQ